MKKTINLLLKLLLFFSEAALISSVVFAAWVLFQMYGILPAWVPVEGASMLPTLPIEGKIPFQRYIQDNRVHALFPQVFTHGDLVVFENKKTESALIRQHKSASGFVKRIIGLPGDKVTIRDGLVLINNEPQKESFTLKPRSTFGGTILPDCQVVTVPNGKLFVLGDNRKVSMDSREVGFIDFRDVQYYIPFSKQQNLFSTRWRDPKNDLSTKNESLFDTTEYIALLNQKRSEAHLSPLTYQIKLERSAHIRAETILKYDDFTIDAKKSGISMQKATADVGYHNIVYGEFPLIGYYEAKELFDAIIQQKRTSDFLLNKDYSEIGVSTFIGDLNGCPVQVVVQHLAGYVPPNYKDSDIARWKDGLASLQNVQPGWKKLTEYDEYYQKNKTDIDEINTLIAKRIDRYTRFVARMTSNEWLTDEEKEWMKEDTDIAEMQSRLAEKLNKAQ